MEPCDNLCDLDYSLPTLLRCPRHHILPEWIPVVPSSGLLLSCAVRRAPSPELPAKQLDMFT